MSHTPSKNFSFCLISPHSFFQMSWGSSQCFLGKLRWVFMLLLFSSGFCLGTLPCRQFCFADVWTAFQLTLLSSLQVPASLEKVRAWLPDELQLPCQHPWHCPRACCTTPPLQWSHRPQVLAIPSDVCIFHVGTWTSYCRWGYSFLSCMPRPSQPSVRCYTFFIILSGIGFILML